MNPADRSGLDLKHLEPRAAQLLGQAGVAVAAPADLRLEPLPGGRNNRTFRVATKA